MPATFNAMPVFGDLPTTFHDEPGGMQLVPRSILGTGGSGSAVVGAGDPALTVTGILASNGEPGLLDAMNSLADLSTAGGAGLVQNGRGSNWDGYVFTKLDFDSPPRKGRVWSVPFTARFVKVQS